MQFGASISFLLVTFATATQSDPSDNCGAVALSACLDELGVQINEERIQAVLPQMGENASLSELAGVAEQLGFAAHGVVWADEISPGAAPAIVAVALRDGRRHFLAVRRSRGRYVLVQDGVHQGWVTTADLRRSHWDGTALHVAREAADVSQLAPPWWQRNGPQYWTATACLTIAAGIIMCRRRMAERTEFSVHEAGEHDDRQ